MGNYIDNTRKQRSGSRYDMVYYAQERTDKKRKRQRRRTAQANRLSRQKNFEAGAKCLFPQGLRTTNLIPILNHEL